MKTLKRQADRAKIVESLRELKFNSRSTSKSFHGEAIQNLQIQIDADRILREIYGD